MNDYQQIGELTGAIALMVIGVWAYVQAWWSQFGDVPSEEELDSACLAGGGDEL